MLEHNHIASRSSRPCVAARAARCSAGPTRGRDLRGREPASERVFYDNNKAAATASTPARSIAEP